VAIEAFIFDMDGLMVETESVQLEAFRRFLRSKGVDPPEEYTSSLIGVSIRNNILRAKDELGLEGETDRLVRERNDMYLEMLADEEIEPLPGVGELFDFAGRNGLKRAVCSSSDRPQLEVVLPRLLEALGRRSGPHDFFDAVVCGDDVERLKPAGDIYLECARRLHLAAARCLAFEDSPPGAEAAAAAGMAVIVAPNPIVRADGQWPAAHVVSSLSEVLEKRLIEETGAGVEMRRRA